MTELLTATQMRAIEKAAIDGGEVTGLELMERAGAAVVEAIIEEWPQLDAGAPPDGGSAPRPAAAPRDISEKLKRAVVLCGPGNNGGDGFVVARLLKERGWEVEVFLYGDAAKLPTDAHTSYLRWSAIGAVSPLASSTIEERRVSQRADLLIDALFGIGLTRPVELPLVALTADPALGETHKTVAIDLPSGVCSDSGKGLGEEGRGIWADLTVTFHAPKRGHALADGPARCGRLLVKSIGLDSRDDLGSMSPPVLMAAPEVASLAKGQGAHKFTYGDALVLSGGAGRTGAARLAARGALRVGAGLVTLGVPPSALMEVACQITAVMLKRVGGADVLAEILQDERINALCLGPGLGQQRARDLVPVALAAKRATILDADALTAFADDPQQLFDLLHTQCVLTPHAGEFARLFPDIADSLAAPASQGPAFSKVDATREAARRAGCSVLFKGADTVVADPTGVCSVHAAVYARSAPWLATAGSGDVLAGFITGLLARGLGPHDAAATAAWLHVECALAFGAGLIAEDLPEELPKVLTRRCS
ncbi:NAD(P)H-hydrate dehydratase [Tritonibacter sp. SIMBA_163]|uniref:NAD(P)H-hydrate dehydratase n=1 Tax=Tritonibacter sp. SIMBA_163 TaxID=3080868 RepID=UPI003980699B